MAARTAPEADVCGSHGRCIGMRYLTRGYQTRSRASNQTRHEGAGLPEDDIENGPILGAESGDGTIMPLDRKIYISSLIPAAESGASGGDYCAEERKPCGKHRGGRVAHSGDGPRHVARL